MIQPIQPIHVRSFSKINLGLAIGPPRPDGFHSLCTLYQTLALHDVVTMVARPARRTRITLRSNDRRVPLDARNTAWKMTERALEHTGRTAEVTIHIQKNLPIQGGMGAGSANAAAALIGLERQLGLEMAADERLRLAAEVGSDVPLFLIGGAVVGQDRGQRVRPAPEVTLGGSAEIPCVVALPRVGVSTPQAFRDWDALLGGLRPDLHNSPVQDRMEQLCQTYASALPEVSGDQAGSMPDSSGPWSSFGIGDDALPANLREASSEQHHERENRGNGNTSLVGDSLLALVRSGIENDFEKVVFPQHPALKAIQQTLMGAPETEGRAAYAALSGSGSAVFGLFGSEQDAQAAQQRLQLDGVEALVTKTLPRPLFWSTMFAE